MWIAFDKEGVIISQINYGSKARQGITSSFSIFACFVNDDNEPISFEEGTNVATINFERPDGTNVETTYFMDRITAEENIYVPSNALPDTSTFFQSGIGYPGFIFSPTDPAILGMAGQYKATIKVYRTNEMIFSGLAIFNVENAVYNEQYNISATQWEELMRYLPKVKYATQEVDITVYPNIDAFLASSGEEGIIYLYPIDTTQPEEGYYQYLWISTGWVNIGTTHLNNLLSDYARKTEVENLPTDRAGVWDVSHRQMYFADSSESYCSGSLIPNNEIYYETYQSSNGFAPSDYLSLCYLRTFTFEAGKTYTIYIQPIANAGYTSYLFGKLYLDERFEGNFTDSAGGTSRYFANGTATYEDGVIKKTITMINNVVYTGSYAGSVFNAFIKLDPRQLPNALTYVRLDKLAVLEGEMSSFAHISYDPNFYYQSNEQKLYVPHVTTGYSYEDRWQFINLRKDNGDPNGWIFCNTPGVYEFMWVLYYRSNVGNGGIVHLGTLDTTFLQGRSNLKGYLSTTMYGRTSGGSSSETITLQIYDSGDSSQPHYVANVLLNGSWPGTTEAPANAGQLWYRRLE